MSARARVGTAFEIVGPTNAPMVVLIHGLGLSRRLWDDLVPALAERYRILTYDLFGHGESVDPPDEPSLALFAAQVRALLDELDAPRAALVGFSLGGMINRRLAIDHPERVEAQAILNAPHERDPEAQRLMAERAAATDRDGPAGTIEATLERWFTPGFLATGGRAVEQIRAQVLANDPATYAACRDVLVHGVAELIRPAPPIVAPTLVMTCEHDRGSTPAMAHAMAAEIPGAEVIVVPGLQHLGMIERPGLFTAPLLRFLGQAIERTGPP